MPPKKGGARKGGRKKKAPAFYTSEEDLSPFGFRVHDIVRTPLGLVGTVIGVKYPVPEDKTTGRLWVEYESGRQCPLEREVVGYLRCSGADHIWRDVMDLRKRVQLEEEERARLEETHKERLEAIRLAEEAAKKKNRPKPKPKPPEPA